MFLWSALKAIGGFLKKVFRGRTGKFVKQWGDTAAQIIGLLLLADNLSGKQKFQSVLTIIRNRAAEQGKDFVDHAARLLIELQLADKLGDDVEAIIDAGIEEARKAVAEVDVMGLVGDDARRGIAISRLKDNLIAAKKNWLVEVNRHLNLLIELAVAEKKE